MSGFRHPLTFARKPSAPWYEGLPIKADPDYLVQFDDFDQVALDTTNDWTVVKDTGASAALAADTLNGRLLLTSAATTDNDGASVQKNEIYKVAAGRTIWFKTKVQMSDATQMDGMWGLAVNFATNPENALAAADRICFQKDDGDPSILCKTESGGTETSTDSGVDMADATDVELGFRVDGTGKVDFYVNDQLVATHTTNITTTEMTLVLFSLSGDTTGTKSSSIDYVLGAQTR